MSSIVRTLQDPIFKFVWKIVWDETRQARNEVWGKVFNGVRERIFSNTTVNVWENIRLIVNKRFITEKDFSEKQLESAYNTLEEIL